MATKKPRFTISLPDEMYQTLKEQAARDHRTLGEEITYLLEVYVPQYQRVIEQQFTTPATPTTPITPDHLRSTDYTLTKRREIL